MGHRHQNHQKEGSMILSMPTLAFPHFPTPMSAILSVACLPHPQDFVFSP
jgi:hypothetical protein